MLGYHVTKCTVDERKKHLAEARTNICKDTSLVSVINGMNKNALRKLLSFFYVDEEHKVVFCEVPKAGSTTYKNLFVKHSSSYIKAPNSTRENRQNQLAYHILDYGIKKLWSYSKQDIIRILKEFYKIVGVRHPLSRLHSMFVNKILDRNRGCKWFNKYRTMATNIINETRPLNEEQTKNNTNSKPCPNDVTFLEFLTYTGKHPDDILTNHHLKSVFDLCLPCFIDYNTLFKLETADTDQTFLVNDIFKGMHAKNVHLNEHDNNYEHIWAANNYRQPAQYFDGINRTLVKTFTDFYELDMALFGYTFSYDGNNMDLRCEIESSLGICC